MADVTVKDINVQAVETPTYLWGINAVGRACKVIPWAYPVTSVVGLTGIINQADLRTALGLGNAAYLNTGTGAGTVAVGNHTHTPASLGAEPTIASGTSAQYWRGDKVWSTLDKAAVGLNNVDNTSDTDKPISSATSSALSGKEPTITAGTTGQYWRGDKTWATFPSIQVPIQYNEEGSQVAAAGTASIINFTGAGVDTSFAGNTLTVNVPNAGGGGWTAVDASSTVKGILKLTNDLGGTADLPVVAKINGVAISGTCASGNVITGDSASTASWKTLASAGIAPTASPSFTGDLTLSSVGARIRGDFSNATQPNRAAFQSSVLNGVTGLIAMPNGTATTSAWNLFNSSDILNASVGYINVSATHVRFGSGTTGSGTQLPLAFATGFIDRQTILPTGEVGIGVTPVIGQGTLQVQNVNGAAASGFRNKIINGCMRISKKGNGAAALGNNYFGADGITTLIGGWSASSGAAISCETYANDGRSTSGALHYMALGTPTGASGYIVFSSRIEARDTVQLGGKYVTASCRVTPWATAVTNHYFRIYKANAANNFGGVTLVSQSANYGAIAINQIMQASHTFQIAAGDCITGLHVELVCEYSGAVAASSYLFLGDFQFCEGSKAMPFELRPIAIEEELRSRYYRKQSVWVGVTGARTCFPIGMVKTPTITGGGTGFTSTGTTADTLMCYQTTAAAQTLILDAEL